VTSRTGVLLLNRLLIPTIFGFFGALLFQVNQTLLGNSSKNQNNDKVSNSTIVSSQFNLMDTNGKVRAILGEMHCIKWLAILFRCGA
jgi:nitrogen fixation protein FixH